MINSLQSRLHSLREEIPTQKWGWRVPFFIICGLLVVHLTLVIAVRAYHRPTTEPADEHAVGAFIYRPFRQSDSSTLQSATFQVHVTVADQKTRVAGRRLRSRKLRVREAVEQLLRDTPPLDFRDYRLQVFKRRCRDVINLALGDELVHEVIVTGLEMRMAQKSGATDVPIHLGSAKWPGAKQP